MNPVKFDRILIKLARWSGWVLVPLMLLFFISGYGMTKQAIDPVFATMLHNKWLPLPMAIAFLLHFLIYAKFALQRKIKHRTWVNVYITILGMALLIVFLYLYLL